MASCGAEPDAAQKKKDVEVLPQTFSTLEALRVEVYRNQDWCKNIVYQRGKFSNHLEESSTCNLFQGTPLPFDAQAQNDFDRVAQAVAATGVHLSLIDDLAYSPAGTLVRANFHLVASFARFSYVYSPGYGTLPPDDPREREHTRINDDWYFVWVDWN
jgi:hypothetical protein